MLEFAALCGTWHERPGNARSVGGSGFGGVGELVLVWQSAPELPDWREVGLAAARKVPGGYEYAKVQTVCPFCGRRTDELARTWEWHGPSTAPVSRTDIASGDVVSERRLALCEALLDGEALGALEYVDSVEMDPECELYSGCPSCATRLPHSQTDPRTSWRDCWCRLLVGPAPCATSPLVKQ